MKLDDASLALWSDGLLALVAIVIAGFSWFLDPILNQRVFGALVSAELVILSMMIYLYYKPTFKRATPWLLAGSATTALFLFVALMLSAQ